MSTVIVGDELEVDRFGREFYTLKITTTPQLTAWEASFDGGTTWIPGHQLDGDVVNGTTYVLTDYVWRWLVAGPNDPENTDSLADATLTRWVTKPKIRADDDPEHVVRTGPAIRMT